VVPERNGKKGKTSPLFWHYPRYHGSTCKPGVSIRDGNWKLIKFYEYEKVKLYDLIEDPYEKNDLAKNNSAKVRQLEKKLVAWQTKMKAKLPVPNLNYMPAIKK